MYLQLGRLNPRDCRGGNLRDETAHSRAERARDAERPHSTVSPLHAAGPPRFAVSPLRAAEPPRFAVSPLRAAILDWEQRFIKKK